MAFKLKWSPSAKLDLKDIAALSQRIISLPRNDSSRASFRLWKGWRIFHNRGEWYLSSVTLLSVK